MNEKKVFGNELNDLIHTTKDSRELKRALAVKNTLAGRRWDEVAEELGVSRDFIGKWRWVYKKQGIGSLRMGYQGSRGYLSREEKKQVIRWLHQQPSWSVSALQRELSETYGVEYQSNQSYYALFADARMSWKKSQKRNPQADPEQVQAKRAVIKKKRKRRRNGLWRGRS